jgi:hypothetical protein
MSPSDFDPRTQCEETNMIHARLVAKEIVYATGVARTRPRRMNNA